MHLIVKTALFLPALLICISISAQSQIIQLEFPLPIDSTHFKENKLKRITLRYSNYYFTDDNSISKTKNEMQLKYFVNSTKFLKLIGISETINTNSFDFSIPECERTKQNLTKVIADDTVKKENSLSKIYYTGNRIYRVDLLDNKNQLTGMYLYTYNDYKTLKKIFFYELDSNNDLFLAEKIVLSYR